MCVYCKPFVMEQRIPDGARIQLEASASVVFAVVLLATFTQSLSGFGSGLVTMAFLPAVIGIRSASPLVALFAGTLESFLFWRFRGAINLRALWRLMLGAVIGMEGSRPWSALSGLTRVVSQPGGECPASG